MPFRTIYGDDGLGTLTGTATSLPVGVTLGEVRWNDLGTKKYRLMYNASGASIPTGGVFAKVSTGSPYSAITGTTETGATTVLGCNDSLTSGCVTIPTASYFWGCVYGHPVGLLASNISVGTGIPVLMATDFKVIPSTVPTYTGFAINMGDVASGASNLATLHTDGAGGRFLVNFEQAYFDAVSKQIA
jgi:hypothetical protein